MKIITDLNKSITKENFKKLSNMYNVKVYDIKDIKTEEDEYIYINPYITPLRKINIKLEDLKNKVLSKREDIFIYLTNNEVQKINDNNEYGEIFSLYSKGKKKYKDLNADFMDSSEFYDFSNIKNYIYSQDYIEELYSGLKNETREMLNYGIEELIELYNKEIISEEEIERYNKQINKKVKVDRFKYVPQFIKEIYIFLIKIRFYKYNNYLIFDNKKKVFLLTRKIKGYDFYLGEKKVESKQTNLLFLMITSFYKEEFDSLDGVSFNANFKKEDMVYKLSKKLPFKGTSYNNVKAITYTDDFVYYFRNTGAGGALLLQKKKREYFEKKSYGYKVILAYIISIFLPKNKVLFYEKQVSQFEESASVLFKKLHNKKNVYFLLKRDADNFEELKNEYGSKIVSPEELRYLIYVFCSKKIIGTEVPGHILTIRSPYKKMRNELMLGHKHEFIFLQHGVMFSLSLNSKSRNFFKKGQLYSPSKVVVSGYEEAKHFVRYGGYKFEDIIISGLATFDNKKIKKTADKIVIMLTWRPWDELMPIEDTTYYKAINSIYNSIQDKENLIIVGHPKIREELNSDIPLYKNIYTGSINELLNETKVLISDYSSVVFDAFYRGINVIFWWAEKEECLERYRNKLLLNEFNIFGPIVKDNKKLDSVVNDLKKVDQDKKYVSKYRKIVEFYDNKNSLRILKNLDLLKENDDLIK